MKALLPLLPLALTGCAANLATLQGPETLEPGHVLIAAEAGAGLPIGTTARATRAGVNLAAGATGYATDGDPVALSTLTEAVAAGMGLALSPPGTVYGLAARVGVADGYDVGGRLSSSDWRLDAKMALPGDPAKNRSSALMAGVLRHRFEGLVFSVFDPIQFASELIPGFELQEPSRWDAEVVWLNGRTYGQNFKTYSALTGRLGWYKVPWFLTGEDYGWPEIVEVEETRGLNPIVSAMGGVAVGKDPVWVRGELNLAYSYARTEVLGLPVNFGGVHVFPAVSLEIVPRGKGERSPPTGP